MQQGLVEFSWTFVFQIVNTLVIFLLLRHFLFKPTTDFMEKRTRDIEKDIEDAVNMKKNAEELKASYEEKLANIKQERSDMMKEAARKAEERADGIMKEAREEIRKMEERSRLDLEREQSKAIHEFKNQISELAVLAAAEVMKQELDPQSHEKMIQEFIEQMGETQWPH
ncbi:ATP synthase F0 subcomplex B subunit [Tindallia magadiensis]|uniref:ATP synthase subunit b n=1 Tax=Tindallia magadiensis TaxID=69895 RepID=A0A1I3C3L5_9FIRM|nr:F0F1 ATP synthase subunit B [Tindallia magadiensis]SFH69208.1 ATP synthase F0 subcomplex B subunit [Tindallia magadiensis]